MTGKTHIAVGLTAAVTFGVTSPVGLTLAGIGALMPDIDHPGSTISRRVTPGRLPRSTFGRYLAGFILLAVGGLLWKPFIIPGLALVILAGIPHRGFIHSPAFALALGAAATHFSNFGAEYVMPFMIGYFSHLVADMISNGIPLLWPVTNHRYGLSLVHTGGMAEKLCLLGCIIYVGAWSIIKIVA